MASAAPLMLPRAVELLAKHRAAGDTLVIITATNRFVTAPIAARLGVETLMIGKVLWQEFFNNRDWPVASALAVVMLAILIVPIILFNRSQAKEMEGKI